MNKGVLFNVLSVGIMSLSPLLNKFALGSMTSTKAAFLNTLFGVLFCYLYAVVRKQKIATVKNKSLWLIGLTNAAGVICLYISLELLSPVMVGFLGRFYIVFTVLLAIIFLNEKMGPKEIIGVAVAIVGTFLFSTRGFELSSLIGILLALAYTFLFAFTNMLVKVKVKDTDSNSILFYNNAISLLFVFVYALIRGEAADLSFSWSGVGLVFVASLFSSFIGLLLFYEGLKYLDFNSANLIRSTGPVLTAVYAFPFFPIPLTALNISGAILLLGSVIWLNVGGKKEKKQSGPSAVTAQGTTKA